MAVGLKVIFLIVQFVAVFGALPPINKCQLSDSDCVKSSAQLVVPTLAAGIPEVGAGVLDPMHVDLIKVDLSGLKLTIRNAEIKGLRNVEIDKLSVDMAKKQIQLVYHSDLQLRGKYTASGKLLILPISGDGDTIIKLKNCQMSMDMVFDMSKNSDGKDIIDLKNYKYNYNVKDRANFALTNLFNGNKGLSDVMHTFMNSSWKLLTQEFGLPMFEKPIENVFNSIKAYLKSQPLEDISII